MDIEELNSLNNEIIEEIKKLIELEALISSKKQELTKLSLDIACIQKRLEDLRSRRDKLENQKGDTKTEENIIEQIQEQISKLDNDRRIIPPIVPRTYNPNICYTCGVDTSDRVYVCNSIACPRRYNVTS